MPAGCCGPAGWYYLAEAPASSAAQGSARRPAPARSGRADDTSLVSLDASRGLNGLGSARPARKGPLATEKMRAEHAPELYWAGYNLYRQRDYAEALRYFEAATRLADNDARYWYYRALSERALGDEDGARRSARRAGELHRQGKPRADVVGLALEQVQGPLRLWLREAGNSSDTALGR
jgi:tetratricopeptide (TPR) repeat protein